VGGCAVKRARKPKPAALTFPHDCVVLAVDPGATSGWAMYDRGYFQLSGECSAFGDRPLEVARCVIAHAKSRDLPAILVCERPFAASLQTAAGMGAAFGAWKSAWFASGAVKARIVRVYPSTWRAKVLGRGWGNKPRDMTRAEEVRRAEAVRGDCGNDEAAAILIGVWACRAGEVLAKLPKRKTGSR
jgi:hypothetical protein